jgi:transposase-like protein
MYRTTDLTVAEIALKCGVMTNDFHGYLRRWCRSDMAVREKLHQERLEEQRREREKAGARSRIALATQKYTPALKLIEEGATYEEAAKTLDVDRENLYRWVLSNHPDIHRREHQNQVEVLPNGKECAKASWAMFGEAVEAYLKTDEPLARIAKRFGLRPTSLSNFIRRKFPEAVERRRNKT